MNTVQEYRIPLMIVGGALVVALLSCGWRWSRRRIRS